jgi:hypothetical protein
MKKFISDNLSIMVLSFCLTIASTYFIVIDMSKNNVTTKDIVGFKDIKLKDIIEPENLKKGHGIYYGYSNSYKKTFSEDLPEIEAIYFTSGKENRISSINVVFSLKTEDQCDYFFNKFYTDSFAHYNVEKSFFSSADIIDKNGREIDLTNKCKSNYGDTYNFSIDYYALEENKNKIESENENKKSEDIKKEKVNTEKFLKTLY